MSLLLHGAVLFSLSLWFTGSQAVPYCRPPLVLLPEVIPPSDELTSCLVTPRQPGERMSQEPTVSTFPVGDFASQVALPAVTFPQPEFRDTARWMIAPPRESWLPQGDWLAPTGAADGGGLEGRRREVRSQMLSARGGTDASEAAVQLGLAWLASAQLDDGSWRFNHHAGPLKGKCRNAGSVGSTTGATALAILPFLGAGAMPDSDCPYQEAVSKGLKYLIARQQNTSYGGDLQEGTMYAQGLATLALCEAYAMAGDPEIGEAAQRAIDFVCHAQHEEGGWRYFPGQPGDMTVTGWQVMALKSGQLAHLNVPHETVQRTVRFLNQLQSEDGAFYGYQEPGKSPSPTAIGLLLRMYTGWPRDDARLANGVAYLAQMGPAREDMYFNYYATQVLHHYEGACWDEWNERMRQYLVQTQAQEGAERGSWYFADRHGIQGGRHYTTAMAVMILEVYYRYMPLYAQSSIRDEF